MGAEYHLECCSADDFYNGFCFAVRFKIGTPNAWTLQGGTFGKIAHLNVSVRAVVLINLISTVSAKRSPNSVIIGCRILTVPSRSPYFGEGGSGLSPAAYRAGLSFQKAPFTFDRV